MSPGFSSVPSTGPLPCATFWFQAMDMHHGSENTWRMSSSKVWLYSSSRTGQIPVSLACRCCSFRSSSSCRLITSRRVAGVLDTYWTHSCPSSVHSLPKSEYQHQRWPLSAVAVPRQLSTKQLQGAHWSWPGQQPIRIMAGATTRDRRQAPRSPTSLVSLCSPLACTWAGGWS